MNKRLVWNFEINSDQVLSLPIIEDQAQANIHWEFRYFWGEQETIVLSGLDDHFLAFPDFKLKHRTDLYYLLPEADFNIKIRKGAWFYKPVIQRNSSAIAFGKKIKLQADSVCFNASLSFEQLKTQGQSITVKKSAFVYTFDTHIPAKMEIARLEIDNNLYFSASIESPMRSVVTFLSQHIIGNHVTSDYLTFLKQLTLC